MMNDHERGCQGREYTCTCGYDAERESSLLSLKTEMEAMAKALDECEDYFDNRADADCDQDGFIQNEEMKLLQVVREALASYRNRKGNGNAL